MITLQFLAWISGCIYTQPIDTMLNGYHRLCHGFFYVEIIPSTLNPSTLPLPSDRLSSPYLPLPSSVPPLTYPFLTCSCDLFFIRNYMRPLPIITPLSVPLPYPPPPLAFPPYSLLLLFYSFAHILSPRLPSTHLPAPSSVPRL